MSAASTSVQVIFSVRFSVICATVGCSSKNAMAGSALATVTLKLIGVGPFQVSFHNSAASVAYPITVNSVPSTAEMVNDIGATYQLSLPRIHVLLALEFTQLPVWL